VTKMRMTQESDGIGYDFNIFIRWFNRLEMINKDKDTDKAFTAHDA